MSGADSPSADGAHSGQTPGAATAVALPAPSPAARARASLGELWADKPAFCGATVIVLLILMAVFAPLLSPYDPAEQSLINRLVPPV